MFFFPGPRDVEVKSINASTLLATFKAALNKTGIISYGVFVNGPLVCDLKAESEMEDFECIIGDLKPGNLQVVVVSSCLVENYVFSCPYAQIVKIWTKPLRESSISIAQL